MPMNRLEITRACYAAYESGDRRALDRHLADDLTFFSPPDPGIDRATYFERCWPNAAHIGSFEEIRLFEHGDEVVVTYEATRTDGGRFRNTEVLTFAGDRITRIEVYFGWDVAEPDRPGGPLAGARPATRLPAQDLERARRFYAERLGLEPADERPGGLLYRFAGGDFALYASAGASPGTFTQLALEVDDLDAAVAELRRRGVTFEEVDVPGLRTVDGVAQVAGNYPSKGATGERAAWFRDSENNLIGIGEPVR